MADIGQYRYWISSGVAVILLLFSGVGYQLLSARYARTTQCVTIPTGTLAQLQMHINDWEGTDVLLDKRVLQATDTDDHVNRIYTRGGGGKSVSLWVAYGVRFRDMMPHRPEVCYPGTGWTLMKIWSAELKTPNGATVPCQLHRFHKGLLQNKRIIVLNYYLVNGKYYPDVSAIRSHVWRFKSGLQYVAQIQIMSPEATVPNNCEELVSNFAADSAELIRTLLEEASARARSHADTVAE